MGRTTAKLAIGAMALNGVIMLVERGFSKLMAVPHVLIWTPLLVIVIGLLADSALLAGPYRTYLTVLLWIDALSPAFDFPDTWKWWKGDRAIA